MMLIGEPMDSEEIRRRELARQEKKLRPGCKSSVDNTRPQHTPLNLGLTSRQSWDDKEKNIEHFSSFPFHSGVTVDNLTRRGSMENTETDVEVRDAFKIKSENRSANESFMESGCCTSASS